jgi:Domain of unknown function
MLTKMIFKFQIDLKISVNIFGFNGIYWPNLYCQFCHQSGLLEKKLVLVIECSQVLMVIIVTGTCILLQGNSRGLRDEISRYIIFNGYKLTESLFDILAPASLIDKNRWDKVQLNGLGSVLIATVAFAAAFTIPGGYNQDHGTPVLARRYMFNAFILANALAFMTAFLSIFVLLFNSIFSSQNEYVDFFAGFLFVFASSSMVVAFGLGMYVTLAPNNKPLAILILVFSLFLGSPLVFFFPWIGKEILRFFEKIAHKPVMLIRYIYQYLKSFYI